MTSQSRRRVLQKLVILPIAATAVFVGVSRFFTNGASNINVEVDYSIATAQIEPNPESVQLRSPATLFDLKEVLWNRHPALQSAGTVQVFINGESASGNPQLKEGDKLVLLSNFPGG